MRSRIDHGRARIQAPKNAASHGGRRKTLLDDHTPRDRDARDRDERNFWALDWSLEITCGVLDASGVREHVRDLHPRLFPVGWPGLRNLYDGWRARMFAPLTFAELNPGGIIPVLASQPSRRLPPTMQLGALLDWDWPTIPKPHAIAAGETCSICKGAAKWKEQEGHAYCDGCMRSVAAGKLAESFRERCVDSKGNPAQMWHHRRSRNARAVRALEERINDEGVRVEWSDTPMVGPCFRSMATPR